MYLKNQSFLVLGVSRSGTAGAEFLLSRGAKVAVYDDAEGENVRRAINSLEKKGAEALDKAALSSAAEKFDCLLLSPGIPIDSPVPVAFRKAGKRILGESELGALYVKALPIGVTGTNGKSTTVAMIDGIFRAAGKNSVQCGNCGAPYISFSSLTEEDIAVVEISSFQLETLSSFRPHVAVVLNITEDHLDRHYNMDNYIFLKSKILKNSTESEYAVLNADDKIVAEFAQKTRAKVKYFSALKKVDGAYLENRELYYNGEKIMSAEELGVGGKHNVYNALAAICAAKITGVETAFIAEALKNFKGIKHRMQTVGEAFGVKYIDDSKGTNVDSTLKAVESVNGETILLLGGKDKGYDYAPLFNEIKKFPVVQTIIYGENRFKILSAAVNAGFTRLTLCEKFAVAFKISTLIAREGQNVLLSPASASFDEFSSFEERGEKFTEMVKELIVEDEEAAASLS